MSWESEKASQVYTQIICKELDASDGIEVIIKALKEAAKRQGEKDADIAENLDYDGQNWTSFTQLIANAIRKQFEVGE